MKGSLLVDFDGVIHKYSKKWQDGSIYDEPVPGVKEALQALLDKGYEIIIFTTRADPHIINGVEQPGQYQEVVDYLNKWAIPFTRVHHGVGKPLAKLLIDDNTYRFETQNGWSIALPEILSILERESLKENRIAIRHE